MHIYLPLWHIRLLSQCLKFLINHMAGLRTFGLTVFHQQPWGCPVALVGCIAWRRNFLLHQGTSSADVTLFCPSFTPPFSTVNDPLTISTNKPKHFLGRFMILTVCMARTCLQRSKKLRASWVPCAKLPWACWSCLWLEIQCGQ